MNEHPALRFLPRPNERYPSTSIDAPWRRGHLLAVAAYLDGRSGRPEETRILALMDGLEAYIAITLALPSAGGSEDSWDGLNTPAMGEILNQVGTFLNYERGRLDPGTLSRWLDDAARRIGWDSNVQDFIGP